MYKCSEILSLWGNVYFSVNLSFIISFFIWMIAAGSSYYTFKRQYFIDKGLCLKVQNNLHITSIILQLSFFLEKYRVYQLKGTENNCNSGFQQTEHNIDYFVFITIFVFDTESYQVTQACFDLSIAHSPFAAAS